MPTTDLTASIVICTLNRPDDIQRCVATIAAQSHRPAQLIIVDAGELGEVRSRLQGVCEEAEIEFIYGQDQPSTTRQRNKGAEYALGDIVFFLDDDVELDRQYIEEVVKLYQSDTTGVIGGVTGVLDPPGPVSAGFWKVFARLFLLAETRIDNGTRLKPSNFPVHASRLTAAKKCEFMPSTAVSYRLEVFRKYLFDVELTGYVMAEDIDLSFRVSREYELLMSPRAIYRHSKSPVSRNSIREREKRRLLFTQYFFQKNQGSVGWRQLARYWSLLGLAIRYLYLGVKSRDMQRFLGFWDGLRCIGRNRLLWYGQFEPGPLDH